MVLVGDGEGPPKMAIASDDKWLPKMTMTNGGLGRTVTNDGRRWLVTNNELGRELAYHPQEGGQPHGETTNTIPYIFLE